MRSSSYVLNMSIKSKGSEVLKSLKRKSKGIYGLYSKRTNRSKNKEIN